MGWKEEGQGVGMCWGFEEGIRMLPGEIGERKAGGREGQEPQREY